MMEQSLKMNPQAKERVKLHSSEANLSIKKKRRRGIITACVSGTRYELIRKITEEIGMKTLSDEEAENHSFLVWRDSAVQPDRVQELKNYQRINHFCGMSEICRKDFLARNMAKMSRTCSDEYDFIPRTWIIPSEYNLLVLHWKEMRKKNKKLRTFIMKPSNGAMGNGIHLFHNPERIVPHENMIVQEYLDRPFLLDGYKIDLRLYVLVTHCDPLRAFLYRDGLVRLGTEKYTSPSAGNVDSLYMHLTNYSVNKYSDNFERHVDFDRGSKRSVSFLLKYLRENGYDTTLLWRNIMDLVVKTLIVASPHILHAYRMSRPGLHPHSDSVCFEILGFDIFLDRKLKPWLLEVNRSPSFGTDERVDYDIKSGVIKEALQLLNIQPDDKLRHVTQQKKEAQQRLFRPSHKRLFDSRGLSDPEKRHLILKRRKEELNEKLVWVRKHNTREEHENKKLNNYMRIFPAIEKLQQERYLKLLQQSFRLFLQSRSAPFQKNIIDQYNLQQEEEILNLLEQCEIEENGGNSRQLRILSSMPVLSPSSKRASSDVDFSDSSSSDDDGDISVRKPKKSSKNTVSKLFSEAEKTNQTIHSRNSHPSRIHSASHRPFGAYSLPKRPHTSYGNAKDNKFVNSRLRNAKLQTTSKSDTTRSDTKHGGIVQAYINSYGDVGRKSKTYSYVQDQEGKQASDLKLLTAKAKQEREAELCAKTLRRLENTKIKFPGKSEAAAEKVLTDIMKNWKLHKTLVAAYWLIKLDTLKQQKVIDIVRGTVQAAVQRTWITSDVDSLRIMRIFNRLFNRMHANHGQGLWSCFSASSNSWETMFCKSSETLSDCEMDCCRRIVQLCKDCLLIVYQFANDAQTFSIKYEASDNKLMTSSLSQNALKGTHNLHKDLYSYPGKLSSVTTTLQDTERSGVPNVLPSNVNHFQLFQSGSSSTPNSGKLKDFENQFMERKKLNAFDKSHSTTALPIRNLPRRFTRSLWPPSSQIVPSTQNPAMQLTSKPTLLSLLQ